jgi:hypothetical protein
MSSPTIEEVVYSRLTTFAGLAALIDTRAYPLVIPQDVPLPAVAYQTISSEPQKSHDGFSGLTMTRIQITSVANDYAIAKQVDQQVRAAFNAVSFTALMTTTFAGIKVQGAFIDNSSDDYDAVTFAPRPAPVIRTDIILWHEAL